MTLCSKKNSKFVFCINCIIFVLTLICGVIFSYQKIHTLSWSQLIGLVAFITLGTELLGLFVNGYGAYSFQFWYIVLTNLFMFGIVTLLALGVEEYVVWDLYSSFSSELLLEAGFVVLLFVQACYLGMTLPIAHKKSYFYNRVVLEKNNARIFNAGIIMFVFSLPFRLLTDIQLVNSVSETNNYFRSSVQSGLQDDLAMLFAPAVIFVIASKQLAKNKSLLLVGVVCLYYVAIMILTGDRRFPVTAILAIVLCFFKTYTYRIKAYHIIFVSFLGVLGLNILAVIRNIRKGHLLSIDMFFSKYGAELLNVKDAVCETLGEFGISFYSVVHVVKNIPERVDIQWGKGFWGAIPSILPVGRWMGDFFNEVTISSYINGLERNPVGETIIGDIYANFGYAFVLGAFIFGMFISHFFSFDNINNRQLAIARYYAFFYIEINLVRTCFFEVFRPSCYIYIFFLVLIKYSFGKEKRSADTLGISKKEGFKDVQKYSTK